MLVEQLVNSFGISYETRRRSTFSYSQTSSKLDTKGWTSFVFDYSLFPFYVAEAPLARLSEIRQLASGISADNYILIATIKKESCILIIKRMKKSDGDKLFITVKNKEDLDRVTGAIKRFNFVSDELTAHSSISALYESLKRGVDRYYINRGLFSSFYLNNRLFSSVSNHKRNIKKEASTLIERLGGDIPSEQPHEILQALGYSLKKDRQPSRYDSYALEFHNSPLELTAVVIDSVSTPLDIKTDDDVAPSYFAVSQLREYPWVILTNGRFWRLYSSRVSSSSTNYFEVDLEGVVEESDPKIAYFISLFSPESFLKRYNGISEVDFTFEEGMRYAHDIEDDLSTKIFEGQLFLNLVRAVLNHTSIGSYSQEDLQLAKSIALKLLYRVLFLLYAESRGLLPVEDRNYYAISLENLRSRLNAFEENPDSKELWNEMQTLFRAISKGDIEHNVPEYDGALFAFDDSLDNLSISNRHLSRALRDLTIKEGKGIDYQNLGVRHLGSIYESLLEYNIRQATEDLVVYEDQLLDARYAEDLKKKPEGFIHKGDIFLAVNGLERKGTGSYYTPDELVEFLVKKGLEPLFIDRKDKYLTALDLYRKEKDVTKKGTLAERCNTVLLDFKVVDPAMGSGHFLVETVDEITKWIIGILKENPDSPLLNEIRGYRDEVIKDQERKGISIDTALLTDTVILKRIVMKRCVYGVDVNYLAVELAKLSLWLDSFTIGTPLTFLDHHIKCGDSLIGGWLSDIRSMTWNRTLEGWSEGASRTGRGLTKEVILPPDLTLEQVEKSRNAYLDYARRTEPLRTVLDVVTAGIINPELKKRLPQNLVMIEEFVRENSLDYLGDKGELPNWWTSVNDAIKLAKDFNIFHWGLEFPDVFQRDEGTGFDLLLTNPPWEAVKPDDDAFFSVHIPKFRMVKSKNEKNVVMNELLKSNSNISVDYNDYKRSIESRLLFYKSTYKNRGSGDTNLWKLFLERSLSLVNEKTGIISAVLPSGVITDIGAKPLREELFKGTIRCLYEFENTEGIFPSVHRSYKYALLVADKSSDMSEEFPAAFYLHSVKSLSGASEEEKFVTIPKDLIRMCAPVSLSIPEIRGKKELSIFQQLYLDHPLLSDAEGQKISVSLMNEFHRTNDSDLFRTDGAGWPLIEGKNFHQFIINYEKPYFTVEPEQGIKRASKHKEYSKQSKEIHEEVRLAFRNVASSTNLRGMIACLIPPHSFLSNSGIIVHPNINDITKNAVQYRKLIAYIAAVFNSFIFDFLIRSRISMNLNFFYVYQTPIPVYKDQQVTEEILNITARLSCIDDRYVRFASTFGIAPKPIDMRERISLTSKLNALVGLLYGVSHEQFSVILQSFNSVQEDDNILSMRDEIEWNDVLIRKFNGEVLRRVLQDFDEYEEMYKVV